MILVDTSVWIEYLRDTDDPVVPELDRLFSEGADVRTTEPIIMELLAGATTQKQEALITQLTNGLPLVPIQPALDYRSAAQIFVASGRNGHPIRSGAELFHRDRDFGYIAEVAPLRLYR